MINKLISRYEFQQLPEAPTRFILTEHYGQNIENFPATWKKGKNKGKQYICFRPTATKPRAGHRYFSYTLEMAKPFRTFTGVNFTTEYPFQTFGDDKSIGHNNAVMVRFSEDWRHITILFYKGMVTQSQTVFEKWTAGELCETVTENILPLPADEKKPMTKNEHR